MDKNTFKYIWDKIADPVIKQIDVQCRGVLEETGPDMYFELVDGNKLYRNIKHTYEKVKDSLKENYYKNEDTINKGNLIDVHKIAACLCYSFIQNKPFDFKIKRNMPWDIFLSNYKAAFNVSTGFVYISLIADYFINGYDEFANKLLDQKSIRLPITSKGHDDYSIGRINALALNDLYGNTFDLMSYADMMFWIEYYNRQLVEQSLNPVELDRCTKI